MINYKHLEQSVEEFEIEKKKYLEISDELNLHVENIHKKIKSKSFQYLTHKDINKVMDEIMNEIYERLMNNRKIDEDDIMEFHVNHQIELKKKNILWR